MTINRKRIYAASLVAAAALATAAYNGVTAQQPNDVRPRSPFSEFRRVLPQAEGAFFDGGAKTHELVQQYSTLEDEVERAKIVKELTDLASEEFEQKQANRGKQLDEMEAQLKRLRAIHDRRTKEKDEIVRDHVRHLLRGADGLGWGVDGDENQSIFGQSHTIPGPGGWGAPVPRAMPGMPPGGYGGGRASGIGVKPSTEVPATESGRAPGSSVQPPSRR